MDQEYINTKINSDVEILDGKISSRLGNPSADGLSKFMEVSPVWRWILLENVTFKRDVLGTDIEMTLQ